MADTKQSARAGGQLRETAILEDEDVGGEELALLGSRGGGGGGVTIQPGGKSSNTYSNKTSHTPNGNTTTDEIHVSIIGVDGGVDGQGQGQEPRSINGMTTRTSRGSSPEPLRHSTTPNTLTGSSQNASIGNEMPTPAVVVEQGYKNYGPTRILNDFNMCVHQNTIYGLLGASGCGKTTILSCIVAIRKLDSGRIKICGWPTGSAESGVPGKRVGYMPQEIALNCEFRVKEVLQYFGRIYGMTQTKIMERYDQIIKLLSLEKCKTNLIRNLSEGQKRRVSLAVALLHEPDLLILDEPTVGCDPLLRENIWKFLNELVAKRQTTVIVTTHYIEETRQADRVGLMRNGRLLVEDAPGKLLVMYNATLLDDIVLQLCHKDEAAENSATPKRRKSSRLAPIIFQKDDVGPSVSDHDHTGPVVLKCSSCKKKMMTEMYRQHSTSTMDRLRALILKNVIVLYRNFLFLLFLLILPTITVLVFCVCVGSEPLDLRLGVVNNELLSSGINSSSWQTMRDIICEAPQPLQCENKNLSCLFLDSINKQQVKLIPFQSIDAAVEQVHLAKLWGYISFENDFSQHIFSRLLLGKRNNATIEGSQIKVRLDMSNKGVGLTLKKILFDSFRDFTTKLLESCSIDPTGRDLPVTFEHPIYGNDEKDDMIDFMGPGVSLGMVFFMGALTCGLTYIIEKKDGMINRTLVTGVSTVEIMLSHFVTQFVVVLVQVIIVLVILLTVFGLSCEGSLLLAFTIIMLSSVSGMSLGFLAATFCNEEKNAMLVAMGTVFPSFLLAGLIWPIQSAPRAVQYLSFLFPGTLIAEAFRSVLLRGFGLSHHVIWQGLLSGAAWICVYWLITVVWHRLQKKL